MIAWIKVYYFISSMLNFFIYQFNVDPSFARGLMVVVLFPKPCIVLYNPVIGLQAINSLKSFFSLPTVFSRKSKFLVFIPIDKFFCLFDIYVNLPTLDDA